MLDRASLFSASSLDRASLFSATGEGDGEEFSFGSGKRSTELHLLRRDLSEISAFWFVCVRDKRRCHQDRGSSTAYQRRRRNFPSWMSVHLELDCSCCYQSISIQDSICGLDA
ncbi:hypothetical protein M6B38_295125 [Iris pallida]|uniref:Uncharacterized protein n=1 Tax=Iris pallida TaxID=29817 RepID=A0AAX6HT97_IRIPA|nr:hypothetical protein M6B38_295125 [Iris pallida]